MRADEVAEVVHLPRLACVVLGRSVRFGQKAGEKHELHDGPVDRRRLERFEEGGREAEGHAVADPSLLQPPGVDGNVVARLDGVAQNRLYLGPRGLGRGVCVGIDIAAAIALLRRDPPHPARAERLGQRHRRDLFPLLEVHPERHRAVDGEGVCIADPFGAQSRDQRAAKAGAVDEKVGLDPPAGFQRQRGDAPRPGLDAPHLIVDQRHAGRVPLEEGAGLGLIEVVGVVIGPGGDEAVPFPRDGGAAPVDEALEQVHLGDRAARRHRVDVEARAADLRHVVDRPVIAVSDPPPVFVPDAVLDRRPGLAQERHLVDAEVAKHLAEDGGGSFTHADGPDAGRFHHGQRHIVPVPPCRVAQHQRGEPPRRAAADDADAGREGSHVAMSKAARTRRRV